MDYSLYLVTDDPSRYDGNWLDNIAAAVEGGVSCVQYRDTENDEKRQYERIRALQDMLKVRHVPLVINNSAELAVATHAEGVHVGQDDMSPVRVREIVGPGCEIGLSITDIKQVSTMLELKEAGFVDCIGIGPVYDATKTKKDAAKEMGVVGLRRIVEIAKSVPNVAIGGITLERGADVITAGAKGLAVVSAFSKSADPYRTAVEFRRLFK